MEKIYIQKKDKVITGPYAVEELRLVATDKVWYEGLNEWKRPQQIDFLKRRIFNSQRTGFLSRIFK